jgi:hypothetical protein
MQATARRLSVVSATSCARRRLIRSVRPTEMRATWITSIIGGALFGFLVRLADVGRIDGGLNIFLFFVVVIVFVIGIPQLREVYRGAEGLRGLFDRRPDFKTFYLPTWARMLVWFISTGVSAATTRALGL